MEKEIFKTPQDKWGLTPSSTIIRAYDYKKFPLDEPINVEEGLPGVHDIISVGWDFNKREVHFVYIGEKRVRNKQSHFDSLPIVDRSMFFPAQEDEAKDEVVGETTEENVETDENVNEQLEAFPTQPNEE